MGAVCPTDHRLAIVTDDETAVRKHLTTKSDESPPPDVVGSSQTRLVIPTGGGETARRRKWRLEDVDAGDGPGDDQPLDLRGAFEDRVDLRITVPALHRVLADIAVALSLIHISEPTR